MRFKFKKINYPAASGRGIAKDRLNINVASDGVLDPTLRNKIKELANGMKPS